MIGFNVIGTPNVTGSLMLKMAGPSATFPTMRSWAERERSM